jgi:hypothetical protein
LAIFAVSDKRGLYAFPFNPAFADVYLDESGGGITAHNIKAAEEIIAVRPTDPIQDLFGQMRRLSSEVCRD